MVLDYKTLKSVASGVSYIEEDSGRFIFSRFSKQERAVLSYGLDKSFTTAGVRLEFMTTSKHLNIEVSTELLNNNKRSFYSFDVYCNEKLIGQIKNYNKEPLYPYKRYSLNDRHKSFNLPGEMKKIKIYFPWSVKGMIRRIELDDKAVIEPVSKERKVIMYGDSITQGYDAALSSRSYASRLADFLCADITNKGIGGSGFMPEIADIKSDCIPDIITVAYGTNDWNICEFEDFKGRCSYFFENLTKNYPQTPIFAIAPIWRADLNEERKFGSFSKVADCLKSISERHKNIYFIDGIDLIPKKLSYYRDGYLHLNDAGFELYAKGLLREIEKQTNK